MAYLFVMYIAEIAYRYGDSNLDNEFNVAGFMANPPRRSTEG